MQRSFIEIQPHIVPQELRTAMLLHASLTARLGLLLLELLLRLLLPLGLISASKSLLLLHQGDLNVARGGHVGVDPSVGPVGPPPHLGGAVHLDVLNDQVVSVRALVLSIALSVLEHVEEELSRLNGPPALSCSMDLVGLCVATNSSHETPEGDDLPH